MARQAGELFIEGSVDDLIFYKMDGKYYVRMKSSLTGKKFWKSKTFLRSRESCKRFAQGNKLASKLYWIIAEEKRVYSLFCFLKKKAIRLLKEGRNLCEAEDALLDYLVSFGYLEKPEKENIVRCMAPTVKFFFHSVEVKKRYCNGTGLRQFVFDG